MNSRDSSRARKDPAGLVRARINRGRTKKRDEIFKEEFEWKNGMVKTPEENMVECCNRR